MIKFANKLDKGIIKLTFIYGSIFFVQSLLLQGGPLFDITSVAMILACMMLAGAWTALGPDPLWKRTIQSVIGLAFIGTLGIIGVSIGVPGSNLGRLRFEEFSSLLSIMPILWVAIQIPFWATRVFWKWRLVPIGQRGSTSPLSIADMMTITGTVAISLALLQLDPNPQGVNYGGIGLTVGVEIFATVLVGLPTIHLIALGKERDEAAAALKGKPNDEDSSGSNSVQPVSRGGKGCALLMVFYGVYFLLLFVFFIANIDSAQAAMAVAFFGSFCFFYSLPIYLGFDDTLTLERSSYKFRRSNVESDAG